MSLRLDGAGQDSIQMQNFISYLFYFIFWIVHSDKFESTFQAVVLAVQP